ncbi:MAG: addiction module protein, partial [Desulfococcaceae bacterium]
MHLPEWTENQRRVFIDAAQIHDRWRKADRKTRVSQGGMKWKIAKGSNNIFPRTGRSLQHPRRPLKTDKSFLHPPRRASCFDIQMGACYFSEEGGHPKMIEMQNLSRKEKNPPNGSHLCRSVQRADLSKEEGELESPEWHREVLRQTEKRLAAGEEKLIDWETAKALLLNRSQGEPD